MMRWAVGMRTKRPSLKAFQKAFNASEIVRFHLMRGTWQLVAAEDYRPFIQLCSPKAIAVTKGWMASNRISIPIAYDNTFRQTLHQLLHPLRTHGRRDILSAPGPYEPRSSNTTPPRVPRPFQSAKPSG